MRETRINARITPASEVFPPVNAPLLGIVMLDTRFPRPPGDAGNPASWPAPTLLKVVPQAWPRKIVQSADGLRAAGVLEQFAASVRQLEAEGASAITTSCGFLVLLQRELQAACSVPLVSSSLLQLPALLEQEDRVGVLTISAQALGEEHLLAAGVARERLADVVVHGVNPLGEFARSILGNHPRMDLERAAADVLAAAAALRARAPDLRTVVLECTNMPPYAGAVGEATGWRVLSLIDSPVLRKALGQAG
jgi:hypothetical protein